MKIYDVFISYRRKDGEEIAKSLYKYLSGKGLRVFFDLEKMESGSYFPPQLEYGIKCAPHYILIATPEAFNFMENKELGKVDYVLEEMRLACKEYELNSTERTFHVLKAPDFEYIEEHNLPEDIQGVSLPTWLPLKYGVDNNDIFEKVFREITAVNRLNMWYGASRWYEESRSRGGRFERLDICDTILPRAAAKEEKHVELPINVRYKSGDTEKALPLFDALKESTEHLYLVGQGGIGKTTSLMKIMQDSYDDKQYSENAQIPLFIELSFAPDMYGALYENGKSSFIRRSVFRQIRNDNTLNTVNEKQIRAVDEVFTLPDDIAVDPVTDILSKTSPAPEYLLLLDGLNEVSTANIEGTGNVHQMIIQEIEFLIKKCPNVKVVLTSRSDENALNNDNIQKFYLSETDEESIKKYLADNEKTESEIEAALSDENLKEALSVPLFLSMYARLSKTEDISSQGEIMRVFFSEKRKNIYTAQDRIEKVEKDIKENSEEESKKRITSQMQNFFLDFVLPEIAWYMERNNEFGLRIRDIKEIIEPVLTSTDDISVCGDFGKELFEKYTGDSSKMHTGKVAKMIINGLGDDLEEVTESIVDCCVLSLGILQKTNKKYGFIHQHIRDYFAAVKNINAIRMSVYLFEENEEGLAFECMNKIFKDKPIGNTVCQFVGECLGEHHNKPLCIENKWCYGVPIEKCDRNLLERILDICRNSKQDFGYSVFSILKMISQTRKNIAGLSFDALDLKYFQFDYSSILGQSDLISSFKDTIMYSENFIQSNYSSNILMATISPNKAYLCVVYWNNTIIVWNVMTHSQLKVITGYEEKVINATFSPDSQFLLTFSENKAHCWDVQDFTNKELDISIALSAISKDSKYIAMLEFDETFILADLSDFNIIFSSNSLWLKEELKKKYVEFKNDNNLLTYIVDMFLLENSELIIVFKNGVILQINLYSYSIRELIRYKKGILDSAISKDEKVLLILSDGCISKYDINTNNRFNFLKISENIYSGKIDFLANNSMIALVDNSIKVIDLNNNITEIINPNNETIYFCPNHSNSDHFLFYDNKNIFLSDINNLEIKMILKGYVKHCSDIIFYGENMLLFSTYGVLNFYDMDEKRIKAQIVLNDENIKSIYMTKNRENFFVILRNNNLLEFTIDNMFVHYPVIQNDSSVYDIDDNKKQILISANERLRLFDKETGELIHEFTKQGGRVNSAKFSFDEKFILCASDKYVRIYDAKRFTTIVCFNNPKYTKNFRGEFHLRAISVSLLENKDLFVVKYSDGSIYIYSISKRKLISKYEAKDYNENTPNKRNLTIHDNVLSKLERINTFDSYQYFSSIMDLPGCFENFVSPSSKYMVISLENGEVVLLFGNNYSEKIIIDNIIGCIKKVSFRYDESEVLLVEDKMIYLFNISDSTYKEKGISEGKIISAGFTQNNKYIYILSDNNEVFILDSYSFKEYDRIKIMDGYNVLGVDFTKISKKSTLTEHQKNVIRKYGALI